MYEDRRKSTSERIENLLDQMTIMEKIALMFHINTGGTFSPQYPSNDAYLKTNANLIVGFNMTHILDNNNGTPDYLANFHNQLQAIAESNRLGIPITFSCDRASNTWGGMIDMPHAALGTAYDVELAGKLLNAYAKEMKAMGYHVTLHPSAVELFGTWGDDVDFVSEMIETQVEAFVDNGVQVCLKHWIAKPFGRSKSVAQMIENWAAPWAAGLAAGSDWVMTTAGQGVTNATSTGYYDKPTMDYLRNVLDFNGVALTDWGCVASTRQLSGTNYAGVDMSKTTLEEQYKIMIDNGYDQFGAVTVLSGNDPSKATAYTNWPDAVLNLVQSGQVSEARIEESARRILKTKFELGLFENPFVDPKAALEVAASVRYIAEPWEVHTNEDLDAARNPRTLALDRALQAASSILLKNDGVLPLKDGVKVYVGGSSVATVALDAAAIAKFATVVEEPAQADVAVIRITAVNDAAKGLIGALDGVPTIVAFDNATPAPDAWLVSQGNVAAILAMTFRTGADHGSAMGSFFGTTRPEILADMLFGRAEPSGRLVKDIVRSADQSTEQWGDVSFDVGATTAERVLIVGAIRNGDPVPTNFGDPLFPYKYGMQYGLKPKFVYSTLFVPKTVKPGEAFTATFLLENEGWDGCTTIAALDGANVIASKFVALNGGAYTAVEIPLVLSDEGDHTISIGSLTATVKVAK